MHDPSLKLMAMLLAGPMVVPALTKDLEMLGSVYLVNRTLGHPAFRSTSIYPENDGQPLPP
jgi:hypothetical protein